MLASNAVQAQDQEFVKEREKECPRVTLTSLMTDDWLPEGNVRDESKPGNSYRVQVSWTSTDLKAPARPIFVAIEASSLKGVCGNFGSSTEKDFRILPVLGNERLWVLPNGTPIPASGAKKVRTVRPIKRGGSVTLAISSFDYAGRMGVGASVPTIGEKEKECADRKDGHVIADKALVVPRDTDEDWLPDSWEGKNGLTVGKKDGTSDEDKHPGNPGELAPAEGRTGDGLFAWEEYRGFRIQGSHSRLDPTIPDLFVYVHAVDQLGALEKLNGVRVHRVTKSLKKDETEIETDEEGSGSERINRNNVGLLVGGGLAVSDQMGIAIIGDESKEPGPGISTWIVGRMEVNDKREGWKSINTGSDGKLDTTIVKGDEPVPGMVLGQGAPDSAIGVWDEAGKDKKARPIFVLIEKAIKDAKEKDLGVDDTVAVESGFTVFRTGPNGIRETPELSQVEDATFIKQGGGLPYVEAIRPAGTAALQTTSANSADEQQSFTGAPTVPNRVGRVRIKKGSIEEAVLLLPGKLRLGAEEAKLKAAYQAWTVAHEVGHALHVEHYHASQRSPAGQSVMAYSSFWIRRGFDPPKIWQPEDLNQIRLHDKHE